jgi:hypothetical protein
VIGGGGAKGETGVSRGKRERSNASHGLNIFLK